MGYQDGPYAGDRYQRGREIRTVYDRTLGGNVLYYTGTRRKRRKWCIESVWLEWQKKATLLPQESE